ncbi:MAG: VWA domain-containing protein [Desulfobacterales bacterium]
MKSYLFKRWDGSQELFSLKKKDIVDKFMENIMKGMTPNMSLAEMMWDGFDMAGMNFRVMGLEEMLRELQEQKQELFSTYNLEKAFDKPIEELTFSLADENMTRTQKGAQPTPSYDELPPGLLEKLKAMKDVEFMNPDSQNIADGWQERTDDIQDLHEFYGEYAHRFSGDQSLDFDEAIELMRQLQGLEQLQQQIAQGQFSKIDPEQMGKLLGEQAQRSFNIMLQLPQTVSDEGVVELNKYGFDMTPRGMRSLGELAFGKMNQHLKRDKQGGFQGNAPQTGEIEPDTSRPYEFGDRFDVDIPQTILKAVTNQHFSDGQIHLMPEDIQVRDREQMITSTTIVLLDLSWSMSWEGRFEAGKKVALALDHYIRTRFPKDKFHVVGFSTEARELRGNELALAVWDSYNPYTNLQGGLQLAMKLIKKSGNRNNRVIVITDGQPTAYYDDDRLYVELPPNQTGLSPNAAKATLAAVRRVTAQGMNIETFMLDDNPVLVEFTKQITKINRGRAVMCLPGELGELVVVQEIKRRGGKI